MSQCPAPSGTFDRPAVTCWRQGEPCGSQIANGARPFLWVFLWDEKSSAEKVPDFVVADAVAVEPVSTVKFPANREINREFCRFRRSAAVLASSRRANSMTCIEIPYVTEQGIFGGLTGNFFQRTGNRLARRQADQRDDEMRAVGAPLLSLSGGGLAPGSTTTRVPTCTR